jgi:hypothetical protein
MKILFPILLIIFTLNSQAQNKQNIYAMDANEKIVSDKDDIEFYRVITEPDSGSRYFKLYEYYPNGQKKRLAVLFEFEPVLSFGSGSIVSYYLNGNMKASQYYGHGNYYNKSFFYYSNGKHKLSVNYFYRNSKLRQTTIQISDISGKDFLDKNGNGTVSIEDFDGEEINGKFKKGLKTGVWAYLNKAEGTAVKESYKRGELTNGSNTDQDGDVLEYKYINVGPSLKSREIEQTPGRMKNNFFELKSKKVDEKGVVRIRFDLNDLGKPQNFEIVKSLSTASDEEAINIIKSKKWYPATFRGKPISTYNMIIDVSF